MADVFTATGAKLFIGGSVTNTTDTTGEFAALTWVEITLLESIGEYGDESSIVSAAVIGDGRMRKAKGARDAGNMTIVAFPDSADAGQDAIIAAEATYNNYAFKVELPNKLTALGTNELNYLRGLVTSKRRNVGSNDNIVRDTYIVAVNSPIYVTDPT